MQAEIIVDDAEGPDPLDVTKTIIVPRGTIIEGPECWHHCVPDGSFKTVPTDDEEGQDVFQDADGKFYRYVGKPRILARPVDEECKKKVDQILAERKKKKK